MIGTSFALGINPCPVCKGKGTDPKKRKRKCPLCVGYKLELICEQCKGPWPCPAIPKVFDAGCTNKFVPWEEYYERNNDRRTDEK